jgi:hypothetical protein
MRRAGGHVTRADPARQGQGTRVWAALDRAIAAAGVDCEALSDGVTIEVDEDTDYEPDAVVNCGPPASPGAIAAAGYFKLATIQHYLIVSTRRHEVVHHRRDSGAIVSRVVNVGAIALDPPGIAIDIAELHPPTR